MKNNSPFCVGLTGGIGSGKSTVATLFAERGVSLVDTDFIAHRLTARDGEAMPAIREAFGMEVLAPDGALDRPVMRQRVFEDPRLRERLEAILHPMIREIAERDIALATGPYVMLVVPLLAENPSYQERCDSILLVDCSEAIQIQRVMARSGLSEEEVRKIIATQASPEVRRKIADKCIDNSGNFEDLREQVEAIHWDYMGLAS